MTVGNPRDHAPRKWPMVPETESSHRPSGWEKALGRDWIDYVGTGEEENTRL